MLDGMLSVGWIMFWKAVILGAWAGVVVQYAVYKTKRARNGITLKHDRRRNLHYDPLERWETRGRKTRNAFMLIYGVLVSMLLIWFWLIR